MISTSRNEESAHCTEILKSHIIFLIKEWENPDYTVMAL